MQWGVVHCNNDKEEHREKLERVLTKELWQNYDRMTKEAAEFAEDIFPMEMVKKVKTIQDQDSRNRHHHHHHHLGQPGPDIPF